MPMYPDPNGGTMQAANDADAASKGWSRSMGSFGINTYPDSGGGGSSSSGGSGGIGQSVPGMGGSADILNAFKQSSGFSLQDLAERKRQFDKQLEWQKELWRNQGMPELQIQQMAQQLAQQEYESQKALAQKNFELAQKAQAAQESQFGQTLAEQQRQFNTNTGLDYLKTAANMGSPADVFQSDDFVRGAAANGAPAFLSALRNNIAMPAFGATSGAAPNPLTAGGLMDRLSGGLVPDSHAAALGAIGGMAQAGGGALSPQEMESLNPDELAAMQSGFKKLGYSMPAFLQSYTQSRIGQGAARNY